MAAPSQTDVTIAKAPAGYNCLLSISGYGSRTVRCQSVSYGVAISTTEDNSAHSRTLYPLSEYVAAYDLALSFTTRTERDKFCTWLRTYMNRVSRNEKVSGYVYVQVPARRQAFNGVPIGRLLYGDALPTDLTYPLGIRFIGVADPISAVGGKTASAKLISTFQGPKEDRQNAPYFYPAGRQKSGAESLAGTLYDPVYVPPPAPRKKAPTGGGGGGPVPRANPW